MKRFFGELQTPTAPRLCTPLVTATTTNPSHTLPPISEFERGVTYKILFERERKPWEKSTWRRTKVTFVGSFLRESADGEGWIFLVGSGASRTVPKVSLLESKQVDI